MITAIIGINYNLKNIFGKIVYNVKNAVIYNRNKAVFKKRLTKGAACVIINA